MAYPNATGKNGPTVQPSQDQGLVPEQRRDSELRGTGQVDPADGTAATTSINAVGAQGIDPASSVQENDNQRDRSFGDPYTKAASTTIVSPSPGMDSDIGAPMLGTKLGGSKGRKASGGSGRHGGAE